MIRSFRMLAPLALLGLLALGSCALSKLDAAGAVGNWTGNWSNTTFASSGTATMTITRDTTAKTLTIVLDPDGNVFGSADPVPQTIVGNYTDSAVTATGTLFMSKQQRAFSQGGMPQPCAKSLPAAGNTPIFGAWTVPPPRLSPGAAPRHRGP